VLIPTQLLPADLRDLQRAAVAGGITERQLIDYLERLLGAVATAPARKVLIDLSIDPVGWFTGLGNDQLPKLAKFLDQRLPRAW